MKFSLLIFFCILFSRLAYSAEICTPKANLNACEIHRFTCAEEITAYVSLYGESVASDLYGTCPLNTTDEMAASAKNCAIPGLFITATLAKNIAVRTLAGVVSVALLVDTLNEAAKDSEKCFLDIPGKLKVIDEYNAKVEFSRSKVPFKVSSHKINLPKETVENMTCVRLAQHISYRNDFFDKELAKNIKKVNPKDFEQIINFSSIENQLTENGVDLSCIRPSKKALIMCEVAAVGAGVGMFAASKLAQRIGYAKAIARNPKRFLAERKERKLDTYIADSVTFSNAEITSLQRQADTIFSSNLSDAKKITSVSSLYLEARLSKLPPHQQESARTTLKNIKTTDEGSYYQAKKIFIKKGLDPNLIEFQRVLGHEFEHVIQGLTDKNRKSMLDAVKFLITRKKVTAPETYGDRRYRYEIEAIGAQYDMVQLFPKNLIQAEASGNKVSYLSKSNSGALELVNERDKILLATTLPRDQYIATIRKNHGYNGLWAAELDIKNFKESPVAVAVVVLPVLFTLEKTGVADKIHQTLSPKDNSPQPTK